MILVAGATGTVGGEVVRALKAMPAGGAAAFRALVRRSEAVREMKARGVDAVLGDLSDPQEMAAALAGVERLFLVSSPSERLVEIESAAADAAKAAGVRQIVKLSGLGSGGDSEVAFMRSHRAVEEHVEGLGVPYVFLRPNSFFQNFLGNAGTIRAQSAFYAPAGDARVSFVDAADIGAVAARVLTDPVEAHAGRAYDVTGIEALSHDDIARAFSDLLGREIRYVSVEDAAAREGMIGLGVPEWQADAVVALYRSYRTGGAYARVADTVPRLAGRPARTFAQFLNENAAAFG
ncbi:MAG TPA: SDR family oxidoreductase [Armatimonadaceae bacterium]|nr:SDR family oxidoreductase [Armatimonadaceae bacterium]